MDELLKPIRVLHIVSKMNRGGVETMLMNYFRNIDKTKVVFDFIEHGEKDEESHYDKEIRELGGKIYYVTPKTKSYYKNTKEMMSIMKENNYTIVHAHQDAMNSFALKIAKKSGVKVRIAHAHSTGMPASHLKTIIYNYSIKQLPKYANKFFTCSEKSADYLFPNVERSKIHYIRNSIDLEKFKFNNEIRVKKKKDLGLEDFKIIGHVGNFLYPKNHKFIINLFEQLLKCNKQYKLVLCGGNGNIEEIKQLVKSKNLSENVLFLGNREDVNELLNIFDVFILPSIYEGLPVSTIEAQVNGLPVIVSDSITKEINISKKVQFISLKSIEDWIKCILLCSEKDRKSENTELFSEYNIKSSAENLVDLYEECIGENV